MIWFEPGEKHWHGATPTTVLTHIAIAERLGGSRFRRFAPSDVIWFEPGEKHWHGATPTTVLTHIAIAERLGGKTTNWMEQVSEEHYQG